MIKYCMEIGCISRATKKAKPREWIKKEWDLCGFHYNRAAGKEEDRPTIFLIPG